MHSTAVERCAVHIFVDVVVDRLIFIYFLFLSQSFRMYLAKAHVNE